MEVFNNSHPLNHAELRAKALIEAILTSSALQSANFIQLMKYSEKYHSISDSIASGCAELKLNISTLFQQKRSISFKPFPTKTIRLLSGKLYTSTWHLFLRSKSSWYVCASASQLFGVESGTMNIPQKTSWCQQKHCDEKWWKRALRCLQSVNQNILDSVECFCLQINILCQGSKGLANPPKKVYFISNLWARILY